jgi:hypothetical protein
MTACLLCPAVLHREADTTLDEWMWADETGHRFGTDADLAHVRPSPAGLAAGYQDCPDGRWAELRDQLAAAQRHTRRKGVEPTWLYWASAREYSALKVRLEIGGTFHEHHPATASLPPWDGPPPPECCGWPMRLRPSGWHCRQGCGHHMPLAAIAGSTERKVTAE